MNDKLSALFNIFVSFGCALAQIAGGYSYQFFGFYQTCFFTAVGAFATSIFFLVVNQTIKKSYIMCID